MRLHAITVFALTSPLLASCGSSWDIRKGDKLTYGCNESYFYADADGDTWGDPNSEPQKLCTADVQAGLTASNGRDCDDGDPDLTGLVGTSCPEGLVGTYGGAPVPHAGRVVGNAEFAFVFGSDAPVVRHGAGVISCEGWAGKTPEGEVAGGLATFASPSELQEAQDAIDVAFPDEPYAAFVGVEWDDVSALNGSWTWSDDSEDSLIDSGFSWCGGVEPVPGDFFPLLNTGNAEHIPAINAQLPELRLAMVRTEAGSWCLGLPWHAIPDDIWDALQDGTADLTDPFVADMARYTTSDAHVICKRTAPDASNYRHIVADEDNEG